MCGNTVPELSTPTEQPLVMGRWRFGAEKPLGFV
jgi:hypothetical protein